MRPRVVLCGMPGPSSALALRQLLADDVEVAVAVVAVEPPGFPSFPMPAGELDVAEHAAALGVPVRWVDTLRGPAIAAELAAHHADALVACCFPLRVPPAILRLPPLGCINVHPSLLPRWRGVEPLFWPFREGAAETGTTVHLMEASFDTGPILAQARGVIPDGIRLMDLERHLVEIGVRLVPKTLQNLAAGTAGAVAQSAVGASTAPLPGPADLVVSTDQPARWAFNFVRGVAAVYGPMPVRLLATGETHWVTDALSYAPETVLRRPIISTAGELAVQFTPGVVRFVRA